ncbi:hypothetical protein [Amycolatopsis thermoflava]|uniref:hypothetical protein n=1 Tax=Amycolatopsis thermoflava TaxID=84480 RepID=UPI003F49FF1C
MARTSVVTQAIVQDGMNPVLTAPTADGDVIDTGRVFLEVVNAGASPETATVVTPLTVEGLEVEDLVVTIPAGGAARVGPISRKLFGQPVGSPDVGRAYVNYSSVSGLTRGVFSLP